MAVPTELARPPITEALIDLRAPVDQPQSVFERFAHELRTEFPDVDLRRGIKAELRVEQGKLIPPIAEDLGFQGVWLKNAGGTLLVQARPDGFTLNNLTSYVGGERLIEHALAVWSHWARCAQPRSVERVALRYLNQLLLPLREGEDFSRFLTAAPQMPAGAPQTQSEFLTRVVSHDQETGAAVIVTQVFSANRQGQPALHIDIDAFRAGEFPVDAVALRPTLESLRIVKNRTFFSLLTDEAVGLYL